MTLVVIDSSIAVKWVVGEEDSADAMTLRRLYRFAAPELLNAEAANTILNKVRRGHMTEQEARAAAQLLSELSIEFHPMKPLVVEAVALGLEMQHPAYDCMFLVLAARLRCPFVTADQALVRKSAALKLPVISLHEAVERAY
jgi:predicted nucleic acid-binding protein